MISSRTFKIGGNSTAALYRFSDIFTLICTLYLACFIYGTIISNNYITVLLIVTLSYLYTAETLSLYRSWRAGKLRHMVILAWVSLICAFVILFLVAFALKFTEELSRVTLTLWFSFSIFGLLLTRGLVRLYKINRRKLGFSTNKVAIVGATEGGANLYQQISQNQELGYDFVGFFDDRKPERLFKDMDFEIEGIIDSAVQRAKNGEIDVLFIALPLKAEKRIADILLKLGDTTVDVHFIPDFLLSNLVHARIEHIGNIDTLSVFESPYFGARQWVKRTEDIILSSIILLLISPLLFIIALGVKLTSKGPILFKQHRYGLAGQKINVWKFRSMYVMENKETVTQATRFDPRVTPLGRFLRRTSLDELPQFFNVLLGDMSIVGPRPHAVAHNEEYRQKVEFYMLRHKVKPGITGWAQINGWRGETDTLEKMEKRIEFDLQYIKNWSLIFDLKIVFMTIFQGFVNKNAY